MCDSHKSQEDVQCCGCFRVSLWSIISKAEQHLFVITSSSASGRTQRVVHAIVSTKCGRCGIPYRRGYRHKDGHCLQSFQMKTGQLHVFRSPQARATSPSVPRGTKLIVYIPPEFLPAGFTSYEDEMVFLLTKTRPKVTILRLPGTSNSILVLTGPYM